MNRIYTIAFLFFVLLASNPILAQDVQDPMDIPTKRKLEIADNLAKIGSYYNAIDYYKSYMKDEKDDADVAFKLADAYRNARDYVNAEEWYKKAFAMNKTENMNAQFFYALMMKYNGKYDQAKTLFDKIAKTFKGNEDDPKAAVIKLAKEESKGCELALKMINNPLKLVVKHLGKNVNNHYSDFGPAAVTDLKMIYSSIKSDTVVVIGGTDRSSYVSRIYETSRKNKNGSWGKPKEFGGENNINSNIDHTGNGSFSPDGKYFFFSRCREVSPTDLHLHCDIYFSERKGESWSSPSRLSSNVNKAGTNNTQPAAAKGAKPGEIILYFVSDREEGSAGGQDLYYTTFKKDGSCTAPVNLGKKINTAGDEVTPYYDEKEKTLYFSSNGRVGMGGFDIFRVKGTTKKFEDPTNVGYPINSSVDDRYFSHWPNHRGGFFVSNRPGGYELKSATCCDDIYQFDYIIIPHFAVKGRIYDSEDKKKKNPLLTAVVQITCDSAEKDAMRYDTTFSRNKATYMFNLARNQSYKIHVTKDGYYANNATCSVKGMDESDTMTVDIFIEKIKPKSVRIEGIYYAYDRAELQAESEPALKQLLGILNDNPVIKVEISSHTDNRGNDAYNMRLSQARAESVVKYLITNGIDKQRLVAKGYGETHPDTINQNPDGSDCPVCRARNRRTEFKIIGQIANTTIIYDQAAPITVDSATTTQEVEAREKEGKGANFIGNPNNKPAGNTPAPAGTGTGTKTAPAKAAPKTTSSEDGDETSSDEESSDDSADAAPATSDDEDNSASKSKSTGAKTKTTTPATKSTTTKSSSGSKKKGSVEED